MTGTVRVRIANGELDRVPPPALERYVPQDEWDRLATAVRQILFRGVQHNRFLRGYQLGVGIAVVGSVLAMICFPEGIALFSNVFGVIMVLSLGSICYRKCVLGDTAEEDLRTFLAEYSNTNSNGLALHLSKDGSGATRDFVERDMVPVDFILQISVDHETGYREMVYSTPSSYKLNIEEERDEVKQRQERLARVNDHILMDEYEAKFYAESS